MPSICISAQDPSPSLADPSIAAISYTSEPGEPVTVGRESLKFFCDLHTCQYILSLFQSFFAVSGSLAKDRHHFSISETHAVQTAIYLSTDQDILPISSSNQAGRSRTSSNITNMDSKASSHGMEKHDDTAATCQTQSINPDPTLESQKQSQPTIDTLQGPYQDDSTLAVYFSLRTIPARFLLWFNIAFSWIVGISIATRYVASWLDAYFPGFDKATVAINFVAIYIVYAILAHTLGVFCGLVYELWRNPYARAPTLRGKVGREEEVAMLMENRSRAMRLCRFFVPWKV